MLSSPRALSVCLCVFFLLISLSFSVFLSIFSSMYCVLTRDLRCVGPFKCTVDSYFWLKELNCRSVQLAALSTPCLCSSNFERISSACECAVSMSRTQESAHRNRREFSNVQSTIVCTDDCLPCRSCVPSQGRQFMRRRMRAKRLLHVVISEEKNV